MRFASIQKPARYIGSELNAAAADEDASVRFALAFPDLYEVGMSHLGLKILYHLLNSLESHSCERVFCPAVDMGDLLQKMTLPLYSLESFTPLKDFDFIGFSIQYELCITNIIYMLDLSNIEPERTKRGLLDPIIVAGGPVCVNPAPFEDFFDIIVVGEAEETLPAITKAYRESEDKASFLKSVGEIEGCLVPGYEQRKVTKALPQDLNETFFPDQFVVPYIEIIHDRILLEVMRGCARGCRFCQAGYSYRPLRNKSLEVLRRQADELIASTGYDEVSLSSLSSTDYTDCEAIIDYIQKAYTEKNVSVSLPSLRMDTMDLELAAKITSVRKSSVTFAPEAGSQRMRDIINKNLTEEVILDTALKASQSGFSKLKLYFMIGLPYETDHDVVAISSLVDKILYRTKKGLSISVSISCFVPKPHTPFQYFGQDTMETLTHKQKLITSTLNRRVKLSYNDVRVSALEAALARGDNRLSKVILSAYHSGQIFDSWQEYFHYEKWEAAFEANGLSLTQYAEKSFHYDDPLPWDNIDIGVTRDFFESEAKRAGEALTTQNCFESCADCGMLGRDVEGAICRNK
jgi:radical SAM superfamily enzyme YgiQ (UPF0313 family)